MLTDGEMKRLRALCDVATPGPWKADLDIYDSDEGIVADVTNEGVTLLAKIATDLRIERVEPWTHAAETAKKAQWKLARTGQEIKDATLIAAARDALPQLLDEIEAQRCLIAEARAEADGALAEMGETRALVQKYTAIAVAAKALRAQPMLVNGDGATWGDVAQSQVDGPKLLRTLVDAVDALLAAEQRERDDVGGCRMSKKEER